MNDFKSVWSKLEELSTTVNEIKTMISLGGMIKSAINEVFCNNSPTVRSTDTQCVPSTDQQIATMNNRRGNKRRQGKRKRIVPINASTTRRGRRMDYLLRCRPMELNLQRLRAYANFSVSFSRKFMLQTILHLQQKDLASRKLLRFTVTI